MAAAIGNADEKLLTCPSINHQEALIGKSLTIDSDTCHILWEN
jgi:hypothetical protein